MQTLEAKLMQFNNIFIKQKRLTGGEAGKGKNQKTIQGKQTISKGNAEAKSCRQRPHPNKTQLEYILKEKRLKCETQ